MKKVIVILIFTISLNAYWIDGNTLSGWKTERDKNINGQDYSVYGVSAYQNYILGIIDSVDGVLFCLPKNANGRQVFAIIDKYINENPDKWNKSAWDLVYNPLKKTFPCKKKK